jgi:succinoglycan biosynthesis transport protein ExoP
MDSDPKQTQPGSSYGYSGGYAGYSAAGYGTEDAGTAAHRTIKDYLLILRERIWFIVVAFLVVFSSAILYTLSQTKHVRLRGLRADLPARPDHHAGPGRHG